MKFIPLASSSHGNAYLLEDGNTRLLIECGLTYKKLQQLTGFQLSGVDACLISHEHHDHAGCHRQLIKNGVPVYASEGTADALDCALMEPLSAWEETAIGSFTVLPFPVFHDAAEPLGFLIRGGDGEKLVFATDTVNLGYRFPGADMVAVECNYDPVILDRAERMPEKVRRRVSNAHMSIDRCCAFLRSLDPSRLREVWLLHLSDACSSEWQFRQRAERALPPGVRLTVCPRERRG